MNDGVIGIVLSSVYVSLKEFGVVGSDTYTWGIKDFHKCWLGSLARRRFCLWPAGVITCTSLSALFPETRGYNSFFVVYFYLFIFAVPIVPYPSVIASVLLLRKL